MHEEGKSMTSRERLKKTLNHKDPGKVVFDFGSTLVTGISASALARLRKVLGLEEKLVKIHEPFQVLGEIEEDVRQALGIDVIAVCSPLNMFGYRNENWKPWKLNDGTDVLVGENFITSVDIDGTTYVYPKGDRSARPSARMPAGGFYFDNIVRQELINENDLNARSDFADNFSVVSDEVLDI